MGVYLSPAKVNLFFKVIKKRKDNFHEIASIYQAVSLFDKLSFEKSKKDSFFSTDKSIKHERLNLIIQALDLFREKTKINDCVSIHLEKNIPISAGLGGGSSNAATTLFALNDLFDRPLSNQGMIELSKKIGSDPAFFFSKGAAFCTDVGSVFENIEIKDLSFFIAKPSFGLSTKEVFENLDISLLEKKDINSIINSYKKNEFVFFNDLEKSSFLLDKIMDNIKNYLKKIGFKTAVMSGSGSSFFCLNDNVKVQDTKDISFFKVKSIKRKEGFWYSNN